MYGLLVATNANDAAIFSLILQRAGLTVTTTKNLEQTMKNWAENPVDMVMLALPDMPPREQVRLVRAEAQVPLILVLEQADVTLQGELLSMGADLVVVSTFNPNLLIAQVEVVMRRANNLPAFSLPTLRASGLTLDPSTRTIEVEGRPKQRLTHLEFRLLYTLLTNRGQVLSTDTIVERVWGFNDQGDRDLVRGLISRLRNKVELNPRKPGYIITIPGVGYTFED